MLIPGCEKGTDGNTIKRYYLEAMKLAKEEAVKHMEDYVLMSWYNRDAPQHATESGDPSGVPGHVYYGNNHGGC